MHRIAALCLAAALPFAAHADEGMWTYDNFPSAKVAKKYGFAPDAKWLDEARLSSVRYPGPRRHGTTPDRDSPSGYPYAGNQQPTTPSLNTARAAPAVTEGPANRATTREVSSIGRRQIGRSRSGHINARWGGEQLVVGRRRITCRSPRSPYALGP